MTALDTLLAEVRACDLCAPELPHGLRPVLQCAAGARAHPHPSPRNNIGLRRNPWFEQELVPALRARVVEVLGS